MKAWANFQFPPGFRFHPTDEELVFHYLCRKCSSQPIPAPIIAEIDLYRHDPWDLPDMALYGEKEWYFFSPRDRKYPNGSRPNRAAGNGYWKATGVDKPIGRPKPVGIKKALVFYCGKAPKGDKTNWIMHEYRLAHRSACNKNSLRLDDWVLCRIYNKKRVIERWPPPVNETLSVPAVDDEKRYEKSLPAPARFDTLESLPRLIAESSCSDHVVSPEFTCESESVPRWNDNLQCVDTLGFWNNYADNIVDNEFVSWFPGGNQMRAFLSLG